jgi:hypothetical protein
MAIPLRYTGKQRPQFLNHSGQRCEYLKRLFGSYATTTAVKTPNGTDFGAQGPLYLLLWLDTGSFSYRVHCLHLQDQTWETKKKEKSETNSYCTLIHV